MLMTFYNFLMIGSSKIIRSRIRNIGLYSKFNPKCFVYIYQRLVTWREMF